MLPSNEDVRVWSHDFWSHSQSTETFHDKSPLQMWKNIPVFSPSRKSVWNSTLQTMWYLDLWKINMVLNGKLQHRVFVSFFRRGWTFMHVSRCFYLHVGDQLSGTLYRRSRHAKLQQILSDFKNCDEIHTCCMPYLHVQTVTTCVLK